MNLVLLITITFTFALVHGNNTPCVYNRDNNAYNRFLHRHIVNLRFNRNSNSDWQMYIWHNGLCGRSRQSFFEPLYQINVEQICQGLGHPLLNPRVGNLCISPQPLPFYDVTVDNNCIVRNVVINYWSYVIVACDRIVNQCRPVHFERYNGQMPDKRANPCM